MPVSYTHLSYNMEVVYGSPYRYFYGHINVDNLIKVYIFLIRMKWRIVWDNKFQLFDQKIADLP